MLFFLALRGALAPSAPHPPPLGYATEFLMFPLACSYVQISFVFGSFSYSYIQNVFFRFNLIKTVFLL